MKLLFVLILAGSSFFVSCKGKIQADCLNRIDSLEQVAISLQDSLSIFPYDSINKLFKESGSIVNLCEEKMTDLPKDSAIKADFSRFANIHKGFKKYVKKYSTLKDNLDYSTKQLLDLKEDISAGSIREKEMQQFCKEEEDAIVALSGSIMESLDIVRSCVSVYPEVLPAALFIQDSLLKIKP